MMTFPDSKIEMTITQANYKTDVDWIPKMSRLYHIKQVIKVGTDINKDT